jgi:hypothetical protein
MSLPIRGAKVKRVEEDVNEENVRASARKQSDAERLFPGFPDEGNSDAEVWNWDEFSLF